MKVIKRQELTLEDGGFKAIIQTSPEGTKIRIINVGTGQRQDGMKSTQLDLDVQGLIDLSQFCIDIQGQLT